MLAYVAIGACGINFLVLVLVLIATPSAEWRKQIIAAEVRKHLALMKRTGQLR